MKVLVLQHIACEPPGEFEEVLRSVGADLHRVELDAGEVLPDWTKFDAIVAMGGPMSVNDDAKYPWLATEKQLIRDAVTAGKPFWGTCLGVQLLAASLGARVFAGEHPEVGVMPVVLTDAARNDPVFKGLPRTLLTFQWHGDTFDLPNGAVLLAGSSLYPAQAFRWGRVAYGVQFHVEVTPDLAASWGDVPEYRDALEEVLGPGSLERVIKELRSNSDLLLGAAREMFQRWLITCNLIGTSSGAKVHQVT
jgi:GMP synthase (glutamine-hydrolysing)